MALCKERAFNWFESQQRGPGCSRLRYHIDYDKSHRSLNRRGPQLAFDPTV
jgi:hypothetical protein